MFNRPPPGVRREVLIGLIAIALPLYLLLANPTFPTGVTGSSISAHFYSDKRDMFVFALLLIGIFQFRYRGFTRLEHVASNVGAVCALCIGFFPTPPVSPTAADIALGIVHFAAATLLFALQAFHCWIFGRRTRSRLQSTCYVTFAGIIVGSMIAIAAVNILGTASASWNPVFWFEATALIAFGCSWLMSIRYSPESSLLGG